MTPLSFKHDIPVSPAYLIAPLFWGRAVISLAVLGVISFVEPYVAVLLFVLLGQSHVNLAYLEHFRQKKYTRAGFVRYVLFITLAFIALGLNVSCFVLFVSVFFLMHNFFDDMRMLRSTLRGYAILCSLPIFLFLSFAAYDSLMSSSTLDIMTIPLYVTAIGVTMLVLCKKDVWEDHYIKYVLTLTFFLMTYFLFNPQIGPERLFAFIIITHYLNWYWQILKKYQAISPARVRPYIVEAISANFMVIIIFLAFVFVYDGIAGATQNPIYQLMYTPAFFYVWTLMHLMVTLRSEDYKFRRLS